MRGLTNKFQVLRIDLPGFGKSKIDAPVSIAEMADGVKEVVDALKVEKLVLVGHSMGGYVGLEFAKKYPENLIGLSLFHTHPFADTEEMKKARLVSAKLVEGGDVAAYVRRLYKILFGEDFKNEKLREKLINRAAEYSDIALANGQRAMGERPDNSSVLENIDCPVQFIIGTEDKAVSDKFSREQTHLPQVADIHILQGIGHMGMFEDSKTTTRIVKDFLHFCEEFAQK